MSVEESFGFLRYEINKESHKDFTVAGASLTDALDAFLRAPTKEYVKENVDVFLPLLMISLDAKGTVFKTDTNGSISRLAIGSESALIGDCNFAQTTLRHVDAVVAKVKEEPGYSQEPAKPYPCVNCRKCFDGPKRLERHNCSVIPKKTGTKQPVAGN